jgi:hypothetical protein
MVPLPQAVEARTETERDALERMMRDLFREASARQALADRLAGESYRIDGAAKRAMQEACRLEAEAKALFWLLAAADKASRAPANAMPHLREAAAFLRQPRQQVRDVRDRLVLELLRREAIMGEVALPVETIARTVAISPMMARRVLQRLSTRRLIEAARPRTGDAGPRWRLLKAEAQSRVAS